MLLDLHLEVEGDEKGHRSGLCVYQEVTSCDFGCERRLGDSCELQQNSVFTSRSIETARSSEMETP